MPRVHNLRAGPADSGAVYVGRPSPFGNPFTIDKDGTRSEVVKKFRDYLVANGDLLARVRQELCGRDLVCWCAPEECHADVLLWFAND